ncbi:hypothetical protein H6G27_33150 [Nostoc linckia FACHB-104]|nr:hypothetical protein [Nostoc linckia FACHB-104]
MNQIVKPVLETISQFLPFVTNKLFQLLVHWPYSASDTISTKIQSCLLEG